MRMARALWLLLFLTAFIAAASSQSKTRFYNIDKEIKIKGNIQKIMMEPRYENRAPFVVVLLQSDQSITYTVELSPAWFFEQDLHQGENLTIVGSLFDTENSRNNIIAREVRFRGQTLNLRDKHGFPNWRGGKRSMRGKRIKRF